MTRAADSKETKKIEEIIKILNEHLPFLESAIQ